MDNVNNNLSGIPFRQRIALMAQADKNGDGKLSVEEIIKIFKVRMGRFLVYQPELYNLKA